MRRSPPGQGGWGRSRSRPGKNSRISTIAAAPTRPVTWDLAPACSATAVRDPLVLTEALEQLGCEVGGADPDHLPAARRPRRRCGPRRPTRSRCQPATPPRCRRRRRTTARGRPGRRGDGEAAEASGSSPTRSTPRPARSKATAATIDSTTAMSTPGAQRQPASEAEDHREAEQPDGQRMPTVSPSATPRKKPVSRPEAVAVHREPEQLGSWPTRMVRASPFM